MDDKARETEMLCAEDVDSDCAFVESLEEGSLKRLSDQYVEYLKLIKDNWSSCHASKILTLELLRYIVPRFRQLSAPLRVRILTSLFYIKDNLRVSAQQKLLKILNYTETDANEWVRKMGQLVKPFILNGMIDLRFLDTETAFRIITFIDEHKDAAAEVANKDGLDSIHTCSVTHSHNTPSSKNSNLTGDEYSHYYPKLNFDRLALLMTGIWPNLELVGTFHLFIEVASCTDFNTMLLSNVSFPQPVSSVKLLEEYAKDDKVTVIFSVLDTLPTDEANGTRYSKYKADDNDKCVDLALVFQELQKKGLVKEFGNEDTPPEEVNGLWLMRGKHAGHNMLEVFETLVNPRRGLEDLPVTPKSAEGRREAVSRSTAENQAGTNGESGSSQTASNAGTSQVTAARVSGVQAQSVAAGTNGPQNVREDTVPAPEAVPSNQDMKFLMVLTKCDLMMAIPEEQLSGPKNMRENQESGFTPAIAFTSLLPFLLMMS